MEKDAGTGLPQGKQDHEAPSEQEVSDHEEREGDAQHTAATEKMSTFQRRVVMLSLCLAIFLSALDITIVATALPTITRALGASASEYAWIGSSYTLSNTSSTPIWAKMSDIFGRKSMLMLSNAVFMAGSLIAALAHSPGMLIGGRTIQGIGGGGSTVLTTIAIGDLFRLEDRAKYYGLSAMVYAVASAVGPVLGGVFTETVGWRWCFYINLPFDAASLVLLFFALKLDTPKTPFLVGLKSVDWIGSAIIVGGTLCFLFGLETGAGAIQPWHSAQVICLIVFGLALLGGFVYFEARVTRNPLIPVRIFTSLTNAAAFAVTCLHSFCFMQCDFFLPLYFQAVLGMPPIISGVSMLPLVLSLSVVVVCTGTVVRRTGNYLWPIYFGTTMMVLGTGLFIDFGTQKQWYKIIIFPLITGLGVGPVFQTPMIALQAHVRSQDLTAANSALSFCRTLSSSISIVIGSVLLQHTLGGGSLSSAQAIHAGEKQKEKYVRALRIMWTFYTAMCAIMVVTGFAITGRDLRDGGHDSEGASDLERVPEMGAPPEKA